MTFQANVRRAFNAMQECYVEQLADYAFDAHPFHGVAVLEINDRKSTSGLGVAFGQSTVQRKTLERSILAWLAESDDGEVADQT